MKKWWIWESCRIFRFLWKKGKCSDECDEYQSTSVFAMVFLMNVFECLLITKQNIEMPIIGINICFWTIGRNFIVEQIQKYKYGWENTAKYHSHSSSLSKRFSPSTMKVNRFLLIEMRRSFKGVLINDFFFSKGRNYHFVFRRCRQCQFLRLQNTEISFRTD